MTELERTVDTEVGNDTEKSRLNFLKYVAYGKQLAGEALDAKQPKFSQEEMDAALAKAKADADAAQADAVAKAQSATAKDVLDEVIVVLGHTGEKQIKAEKVELDGFEAIKAQNPDDKSLDEIGKLLLAGHKSAVEITVNDRDPALAAIRAKYVK